ncbi:hypothetical protein COLO4_21026 [Corchorus olitorius]|uniref:Uncharacterized protein n=1 Tax=Corchorus olitorius TaxID=93759 RepID=A0A1R3IVK8_9ROSI|nr:hypothetical protein COLO4_21026 [Corchorus olitorius]
MGSKSQRNEAPQPKGWFDILGSRPLTTVEEKKCLSG